MNFKNKVALIFGLCIVLCVGSYFIISLIFEKLEDQLFEKARIEALTGARTMSSLLEFMLDRRILTEKQIFDTRYRLIPGTKPKKYHTLYDTIFDRYILKIEDEYLRDPDIDYAILIDRNGYVPTHNSRYSKPVTGDLKHDLANSRSKRIFGDTPGIKEALKYNGDETIRVLYNRDTGEKMWNVGAPVFVKKRHWGAFLIGVSLQRVTVIKNQMLILIIVTMFAIISLSLLAGLAVMPRKLFQSSEKAPRY